MNQKAPHTRTYYLAIAFAFLFTCLHAAVLRIAVEFDGIEYIRLAEVIDTSRFPAEWSIFRTPLYPLALKLSFGVFGRTPFAGIVVSTSLGFAGLLLVGAVVRRLSGPLAASAVLVLLALYPYLIGYEHQVLTETGSFFFLALTLYILTLENAGPGVMWLRATAVATVIAIGYYWRSNVIFIAPVVAALFFIRAVMSWHSATGPRRWPRLARPLAQSAAIVAVPALLAMPWERMIDTRPARDAVIMQGMLLQALPSPEDPLIGDKAPLYYRGIRESVYKGNFLSGMRWATLGELNQTLRPALYREAAQRRLSIPRLFCHFVIKYPDRYVSGVVRTLVFLSGVPGAESQGRVWGCVPFSLGPNVIPSRLPLFEQVAREFARPPSCSFLTRLLSELAPLYQGWLIAAHAITLAGIVLALARRDLPLLACCVVPFAYVLPYVLLLDSLDRYAVPVYPIVLANSIMILTSCAPYLATIGRRLKSRRILAPGGALVCTLTLLISCGPPPTTGPSDAIAVTPDGPTAHLPLQPGTPLHNLEFVNDTLVVAGKPVRVSRTGQLVVTGWAVDKAAESGPGGVDIEIDGQAYSAQSDISRPDVAKYFKVPGYSTSGFRFEAAAAAFRPGNHRVSVRVINRARSAYWQGSSVTVQFQ